MDAGQVFNFTLRLGHEIAGHILVLIKVSDYKAYGLFQKP